MVSILIHSWVTGMSEQELVDDFNPVMRSPDGQDGSHRSNQQSRRGFPAAHRVGNSHGARAQLGDFGMGGSIRLPYHLH